MRTILKDGSEVTDPRLDRLRSVEDWRVFNYLIRTLITATRPRSYTHKVGHWLDQGQEGRCVEYAICHELVARPMTVALHTILNILATRDIYWPAQREDQWEGGSYPGASPRYEGTSVLAGMRVAARLGFFKEYRWAFDLRDLVMAIAYKGPAVLGVNWYPGMFDTDADGFIHPTGSIAGGHAILAYGVKIKWTSGGLLRFWKSRTWEDVDLDRSYAKLHNSWGKDWGQDGACKISLRDLGRLLDEHGEACIPVQRLAGSAA